MVISTRPGPSIIRLLLPCRPAAVLWSVRAVIVNTVKRVTRRRLVAHVTQEGREALAPLSTDRDTTASVVRPIRRVGVFATVDDMRPCDVFAAVRESVCRVLRDDRFLLQAAAASMMTRTQVASACGASASAVAQTLPRRRSISIRQAELHEQTSETAPSQIDQWRHASILLDIVPLSYIPAW